MATTITFNGVTYSVPAVGDDSWGTSLSNYLIAISSHALQKTGGTFTLTAEANFGATYGLKTAYIKSQAANPSSAGIIKLGNNESIGWRNFANNADIELKVNASVVFTINGTTILSGLIVNSQVDNAAAIAYSKLNLLSSIVNADVSNSAAIAYSKLNLSTSILNADINASAAIAYSKLAALTASRVLVSDGSGFVSASSTTSTEIGLLSGVTGTLATIAGAQVITNKDIDGGTASNTNRLTLPKNTLTNLLALTRKEGTLVYASDTDKPYFDDGTNLKVIGSGSGGSVNLITDGDAEGTNIWTAYTLTEAVTFTDAGDLVTLNAHNLQNGAIVSFSVIASTTGISINTTYYVVGATTNTFQVASTLSGSALALTTNGSGTLLRSRPVTATGGSPNVTATISSSTPLMGSNSFVFTKDAANRQGEGIATTFSVELGYRAKVMQIEFDYIVGSGTFVAGSSSADSDLIVYIYDVTNSTLIEPSSIKLLASSTTISDKFVANFQTSATGASYRLILHCATTSASAYTVKLDTVRVGPCNYVYGTTVTNPIAYTPIITGFGTVTAVNFKSCRVGKYLHVDGTFTTGTPTAVEGQITLGFGGGNSNVTSASTLPALSLAGTGHRDASGAEDHTILIEPSKTYFTTGIQTAGAAGLAKANGSSIIGVGQKLSFNARVEIEGWDSNSQVSDGYNSRDVIFNIKNYSGAIVTVAATWTTGTFTTAAIDTIAGFNGSDSWTAPTSGYFIITVLGSQNSNAAAYFDVGYRIASGTDILIGRGLGSGSASAVVSASDIVYITAGQTVQARFRTEGTQGVNLRELRIEKTTAPQTMSATTNVSALYTGTPTGTLANAFNTITYGTKVTDTHNAYASGVYTVPETGVYNIAAASTQNAVYGIGGQAITAIAISGTTTYSGILNHSAAVTTTLSPQITVNSVALNAGQTIIIQSLNNGTTPTFTNPVAGASWFSIIKIK